MGVTPMEHDDSIRYSRPLQSAFFIGMKYTTIHHDVRQEFDLTLAQYIVCDSIHQLSHRKPTEKSDAEVAEFVGLDRSHVSACKRELVSKGLIEKIGGGWQTTEKWYLSITFARNGGKSPEMGEIPPTHDIYKESNIDANASHASQPLVIVEEKDTDNDKPSLRKKKASPAWGTFVKAKELLTKEAGFEVQTGAWDLKAIEKAAAFLGSDKHVLTLVQDLIDTGQAHKLGYSISRLLSAGNLNRYKAENT